MGFGEMLNGFASKYELYITPKFCVSPYILLNSNTVCV